jgi:benzoyl-CoA reductase/2-hydroxyglutaryl-CoA dehydratase subunit BcrC/BadD/HgdB
VQRLVTQCRADGVIFQRMKFCDVWGLEAHNMLRRYKMNDGHILVLEREYGVVATGQVKTRVQAFMEAMGK